MSDEFFDDVDRQGEAAADVVGGVRLENANRTQVELTPRSVTHYKAEFTGLAPSTSYAYRAGGGSAFSNWNCFSTACL
jgi:hypothetical protein